MEVLEQLFGMDYLAVILFRVLKEILLPKKSTFTILYLDSL
jgi:hypothetical protein